jgi:predicted DNA-binding transcriptional regulator YafY
MRRADRLFQIVQLLRRRRTVTTAARIAARLGVSERTVYRDIQDLVASGTPIDGEAGVGYRLRADYDLPPLMFDRDEVQALIFGVRIVRQFGDTSLARAGDSVLDKIAAVLPKDLEPLVADTRIYAAASRRTRASATHMSVVREALTAKRRLRIAYQDQEAKASERTIRPLGLFFWGKVWTVAAWCELRADFRTFRLDRLSSPTLGARFDDEPGRTLRDLLTRYGPDAVELLDN